jgi:TetR/AcrR family fatty acid metabolism transcriptional regulator
MVHLVCCRIDGLKMPRALEIRFTRRTVGTSAGGSGVLWRPAKWVRCPSDVIAAGSACEGTRVPESVHAMRTPPRQSAPIAVTLRDRPGHACYNLSMRTKNGPDGQPVRSFIDAARRAQIIAAAIETIADVGYGNASLARIAERLGISKGVISYHFAGKDELIREVMNEVFATIGTVMESRLNTESTSAGMLRTYIESEIAFMRAYPAHLRTLVEIFSNFRKPDGTLHYDGVEEEELRLALIEDLLSSGQRNGEFCEFSTRVMAIAITGALNGVLLQWFANPAIDLELCANELVALFDRATRKQ